MQCVTNFTAEVVASVELRKVLWRTLDTISEQSVIIRVRIKGQVFGCFPHEAVYFVFTHSSLFHILCNLLDSFTVSFHPSSSTCICGSVCAEIKCLVKRSFLYRCSQNTYNLSLSAFNFSPALKILPMYLFPFKLILSLFLYYISQSFNSSLNLLSVVITLAKAQCVQLDVLRNSTTPVFSVIHIIILSHSIDLSSPFHIFRYPIEFYRMTLIGFVYVTLSTINTGKVGINRC